MKKFLFLSLFINLKMFGQSVELKPGSNGFVMIPNVSSLGACAAADKGKIVYLGTDNTLRMCNGGSWVNLSIGSFYMPYYYSGISVSSLFHLENTSTTTYNSTIHSITNSDAVIGAVTGVSQKFLPTQNISGVRGINWSSNSNGYGVYGEHSGSGSGVYGIAEYGYGVYGSSDNSHGVYGNSNGGSGVTGVSSTGYGVQGVSSRGVYGSGSIVGVEGASSSSGIGGKFSSTLGYALITGNGNVGIGLSTPNEILDVNGRMRIRHTKISNVDYTSGIWMSNSTNSLNYTDGAFHGMYTNTPTGIFIGGNWHFLVNSAGNATLTGTLTQSSDRRLKKDFSTLNNSLSGIYNLKGYHYKWIEESRSKDLQTGLIAQEVQKIFPELVQTDEKGFLSVNYIGLVPHLIEAIKELRNENDSLKNNNQTLASRLDKIEAMLSAIQPNTENSKK